MKKALSDLQKAYDKLSSDKNEFGTFHKCCFHIHTPASHDYELKNKWGRKKYEQKTGEDLFKLCVEKGIIPEKFSEDILENNDEFKELKGKKEICSYLLLAHELLNNNIEIAVVTDHNTINGLNKIKEAINKLYTEKRHSYSVYTQIISGIELSCADKNHVVVVFNDDNFINKPREIDLWLESYLMNKKEGTYLTSGDVIQHFSDLGDIAYIAHINTSDMFKNFSNAYKKRVFEMNPYNLIGVSEMNKSNDMKMRIKNLTNKNVNIILDNDSHNIDTINKNNFWIKGRKCNFSMIKEALLDYDISISFEKIINNESYIKGIYIENNGENFLEGKTNKSKTPFVLKFSDALNCIIGGRGTGKSTILEILEFSLGGQVVNENQLNFICEHGNVWILYQYQNKEYMIRMGIPNKDEFKSILERYGYNEWELNNYRYKFDKNKVKKYAFDNRLKVYRIGYANDEGVFAELINKVQTKKLMNQFFNIGYSVNQLVNTAGSSRLNKFIQEILFENEKLGRKLPSWKPTTVNGLRKKLVKASKNLKDRKNEVHSVIINFNESQKKILELRYNQDLMNYRPNLYQWIFNTNFQDNGYYQDYNIKKQSIADLFQGLYHELGPIDFMLKIIDNEINERDIQGFLRLTEKLDIENAENFTEVNSENAKDVLKTVYFKLINENNIIEVREIMNNILEHVEIFNLKFNVNSREDTKSLGPNFKNLSELSLGQKVVSMLSFILGYSEYSRDFRPLIIDQPEDNLDNRFIYKNLVQKLRETKETRQVIIATHNATIVTNAKAEQVCIMDSDGKNGWVEKTGYPGEKVIKNEIINYLEGGRDSFLHKMSIYEEVLKP